MSELPQWDLAGIYASFDSDAFRGDRDELSADADNIVRRGAGLVGTVHQPL
jgi:hypothetical protein